MRGFFLLRLGHRARDLRQFVQHKEVLAIGVLLRCR
jgi:hypothetical protein